MTCCIRPGLIIVVASTLCLFLSSSFRANPQPAKEFDKVFPLAKGTYWIYRGPVESGGSNGSISKTISWKMEVTDVIARQDIKAAVVKGFPDDLWWYTENTQPRDSISWTPPGLRKLSTPCETTKTFSKVW